VRGDWKRVSLRIPLPKEPDTVGVSCCFTGKPGARLWLDDATALRVRVATGSAPDLLAREFPRTLLANPGRRRASDSAPGRGRWVR